MGELPLDPAAYDDQPGRRAVNTSLGLRSLRFGASDAAPVARPAVQRPGEVRLWLLFEGTGTQLRAAGASTTAPRRGRRVAVKVARAALDAGQLFLLVRREPADVVLAVSDSPEALERTRQGLGSAAGEYEVRAVPVVQGGAPR